MHATTLPPGVRRRPEENEAELIAKLHGHVLAVSRTQPTLPPPLTSSE